MLLSKVKPPQDVDVLAVLLFGSPLTSWPWFVGGLDQDYNTCIWDKNQDSKVGIVRKSTSFGGLLSVINNAS